MTRHTSLGSAPHEWGQKEVQNTVFTKRYLYTETCFSKLDLLVRVRYNNPLPAPPFPPKLLKIPTNPSRYARPDFIAELAYEAPLPMVVDAECGMPLDLGKWDCLWEENADKSGMIPAIGTGLFTIDSIYSIKSKPSK